MADFNKFTIADFKSLKPIKFKMKKLLQLYGLMLFVSSYCFAQSYTTEQFFLDKDHKKVATKEASYYTQTNYYQANKVMVDLNLSHNRMPVGYNEFLVENGDTIQNGPSIKWYENTKKAYEMKYSKGVIVGKLTTFYESGKPKREDTYNDNGELVEGKCFDIEGNEIEYYAYKIEPSFPNLIDYLGKEIKYPKKAKAKKIEGTVNLLLTIAKDGTVLETKVLESPHKLLTEEAERVICTMPEWEAGKIDGVATKMNIVLPVNFRL